MIQIRPRLLNKLSRIKRGDYKPQDFIIADAKDSDMGGGISATGLKLDHKGNHVARTKKEFRTAIKRMMKSGLPDIMLTSLSTAEILSAEGAFVDSDITCAVRLNDTTDVWGFRGARYRKTPAAPFGTPRLDRVREVAGLGLYSITFYNDRKKDVKTLECYSRFRDEADKCGMAHFLEVFNPAFKIKTGKSKIGEFVNDAIVRSLAGVSKVDQPIFLKIQYNGRRAMEEIASHDPENLVVGVLGGSSGTTRDTFELVSQTERFGGRIVLFGRKIYGAEDPVELVSLMRAVIEEKLPTAEAVKIYHDEVRKRGIKPTRQLSEDILVSDPILKSEAQSHFAN